MGAFSLFFTWAACWSHSDSEPDDLRSNGSISNSGSEVLLRCLVFLKSTFRRSIGEKFVVMEKSLVGYTYEERQYFSGSRRWVWRTFLHRSGERSHLLTLVFSEKEGLLSSLKYSELIQATDADLLTLGRFSPYSNVFVSHLPARAKQRKARMMSELVLGSVTITSFNCGTRRLFTKYGVGIWNNQHKSATSSLFLQ